jgi:ferredoxin
MTRPSSAAAIAKAIATLALIAPSHLATMTQRRRHHRPPFVLAFHLAPPPLSMRSSSSSSSLFFPFSPPSSKKTSPRVVGNSAVVAWKSASTSSTFPSLSSSSSSNDDVAYDVVSISLAKPMGLMLEECDDGSGGGVGVIVAGITEGGSAFRLPSSTREKLSNARIASVMGVDVSSSGFDDVMDAIVGAPSIVDISFRIAPSSSSSADADAIDDDVATSSTSTSYEVGSVVDIVVRQPHASPPKSDIVLRARVGDNLRKTLLSDPNVELYRGLKKKLGNCGGGGQCGFCAVELDDESSDGGVGVWGTRSEYETKKIGKNGNEKCRLACMNNIVGPATVRTL